MDHSHQTNISSSQPNYNPNVQLPACPYPNAPFHQGYSPGAPSPNMDSYPGPPNPLGFDSFLTPNNNVAPSIVPFQFQSANWLEEHLQSFPAHPSPEFQGPSGSDAEPPVPGIPGIGFEHFWGLESDEPTAHYHSIHFQLNGEPPRFDAGEDFTQTSRRHTIHIAPDSNTFIFQTQTTNASEVTLRSRSLYGHSGHQSVDLAETPTASHYPWESGPPYWALEKQDWRIRLLDPSGNRDRDFTAFSDSVKSIRSEYSASDSESNSGRVWAVAVRFPLGVGAESDLRVTVCGGCLPHPLICSERDSVRVQDFISKLFRPNFPAPQHPNSPAPQHPNSPAPQHPNSPAPQHPNSPAPQHPNYFTPQHPNSPAPQHPNSPAPQAPQLFYTSAPPTLLHLSTPTILHLSTPNSPAPQHPNSPAPQHPNSPAPQHPNYFTPQHPNSPAPQHPNSPAPQHPNSPAPQHPNSPAPQHPNSPAPQHPYYPEPQHPNSPAPQHPYYPEPQHPNSPAPQHPNYLAPQHPYYPEPQHPNSPAPQHPNYLAPQHPNSPAPQHPNYLAPQHPNSPAPQHPNYPLPQHPNYPEPQHPSFTLPQHPNYSVPQNPNYPVLQQTSSPVPQHPNYLAPQHPNLPPEYPPVQNIYPSLQPQASLSQQHPPGQRIYPSLPHQHSVLQQEYTPAQDKYPSQQQYPPAQPTYPSAPQPTPSQQLYPLEPYSASPPQYPQSPGPSPPPGGYLLSICGYDEFLQNDFTFRCHLNLQRLESVRLRLHLNPEPPLARTNEDDESEQRMDLLDHAQYWAQMKNRLTLALSHYGDQTQAFLSHKVPVTHVLQSVKEICYLLRGVETKELNVALTALRHTQYLGANPGGAPQVSLQSAVLGVSGALARLINIYSSSFNADFLVELPRSPHCSTESPESHLSLHLYSAHNLPDNWVNRIGSFSLSCSVIYAGRRLCAEMGSRGAPATQSLFSLVTWDEVITFPIPVWVLPYESMLVLRLSGINNGSNTTANLAWSCLPLYSHGLSEADKQYLWNYRSCCKKPRNILPLVLGSAPGWDPPSISAMYRVLGDWTFSHPTEGLALLNSSFSDQRIRETACREIGKLPNDELLDFLPQLVQAVKFEWTLDSPLVKLLLHRSMQSIQVAHRLFWLLTVAQTEPHYGALYRKVLAALQFGAGKALNGEFHKQKRLIGLLGGIAGRVKKSPDAKRQETLQSNLHQLEQFFQEVQVCRLPQDPAIIVRGIDPGACSFFKSNASPLKISFLSADPLGQKINVIFKLGDDLRQDMLVLQIVGLIDRIWLHEGLDLRMITYRCLATGQNQGLVQMVPDATTLAKIHEHSGILGPLKDKSIKKWFKGHHPTQHDYEKAKENFLFSCAGWCVVTFILGVCDRHNDNIMVTNSGHMFHIDFGKFLGHAQKFGNIKRDRAPFIFTSEMEYFITDGGRSLDRARDFVELCCRAYNIVRRRSHLLLPLLELMLQGGLPELCGVQDLRYLHNNLRPQDSDPEATSYFTRKFGESLQCFPVKLNNLIHTFANMSLSDVAKSVSHIDLTGPTGGAPRNLIKRAAMASIRKINKQSEKVLTYLGAEGRTGAVSPMGDTETRPAVQLHVSYKNQNLSVLIKHLRNIHLPDGSAPSADIEVSLLPDPQQTSLIRIKSKGKSASPIHNELVRYFVADPAGRLLRVAVRHRGQFVAAVNVPLDHVPYDSDVWFPLGLSMG
ncbi:phosphatidylinositol 4-phosphate 3-kinase C2 domain-containing subunit gamma isoform X2 [Xenopus tropicalis]|uniref:Phosphatidylinositol 4-phosphate 3-kinase C2 domain-containing subunit gamma isoform X2 n=1 Tax=Xenopus tropicalis TaxID=8364 RepID=A0A8J1JB70_XENTR|nr:phosphatidylinositol 4-phosphate 3-kinase C2 domain-containing subunit gamma isoform X2 [Xenopus tropicalis]